MVYMASLWWTLTYILPYMPWGGPSATPASGGILTLSLQASHPTSSTVTAFVIPTSCRRLWPF